jgi:predicted nucleotidyltransferase
VSVRSRLAKRLQRPVWHHAAVIDEEFLAETVRRLSGLRSVQAVSLGGSRAQGTFGPDSDWDLAIYYRHQFDPQSLRDLGWPGEVSEIGGWGGGVFNGGAWLTIDGRKVDVHYRDLDVVEHQLNEARQGRFHIEQLLFHLAGIPSYLLVAELAINRVLHGALPRPEYPEALRRAAPPIWWQRAELIFDYAATQHAAHGRVAQCLGLTVQAASMAAHAVLAASAEWITNEKLLLARAGLQDVDAVISQADTTRTQLARLVGDVRGLCAARVDEVTRGRPR